MDYIESEEKKACAFQDGEVPIISSMPIQTDKPLRSLNQVDIECNLQKKKCKTGQCGGIVFIYHERELDSDPDLFFSRIYIIGNTLGNTCLLLRVFP